MSTDMLTLLEEICLIDSRTRQNPTGTVRVAEVIAAELEPLGFKCELQAPEEEEVKDAANLLAVKNPEGSCRVVLLGHIDTVLSPEEVPFHIDREKGLAYGAGVSDMKGGVVVLVEALKMLADNDNLSLTVILNGSEEKPVPSFAPFARDICKDADAVLNFEPGVRGENGEHIIAKGRKGIYSYIMKTTGRAGHAGNHHQLGANAVREIARKVEKIEQLTCYEKELTANVGRIEGGRVYNQIPDSAEIEFELRGTDFASMDEAEKKVDEICSVVTVKSVEENHHCQTILEKMTGYPPFEENENVTRLVNMYIDIAKEKGINAAAEIRGGASDSNYLADIAPVIDGLGVLGADFHNKWEWADISTMQIRAELAAELIKRIAGK
ncbi:MAG: M20/M25/M40 family metallo-hydrolase [Planctomycetota bacterium]